MEKELHNQECFGCGHNNPIGLKLKFHEEGGKYMAKFMAGPEYQGYDGIVHGGIVSTILDEIMARYSYEKGLNGFTARLEVRYRHPTPIGREMNITAWEAKRHGKTIELAATIAYPDGTVTAEGKATLMNMEK